METTPLAQPEPLAAFSVLQIGRRRDYDFPLSKGKLEIFGSRPECEVCEESENEDCWRTRDCSKPRWSCGRLIQKVTAWPHPWR